MLEKESRKMSLRAAALLLGAALALSGCVFIFSGPFETAFQAPATPMEKPRGKLVLNLAVNDIYCQKTACSCVHYIANRHYEALQLLLSQKYGIDLKLTYFIEPYDFDKAVASGKFDGAISKPWRVYAIPGTNSFKRVADIADPNGNRWLSGVFIVPKNSTIKKIEDLTDKRLAIGNKDAYEKHYAALELLDAHGVRPKILERASCLESIGLLLDGKIDAAAISNYTLYASCAIDIAKQEDFRVIAETEKIPLTSIMLDLSKVSEADATRLQRALLNAAKSPMKFPSFRGRVLAPIPWKPPTEALRGK